MSNPTVSTIVMFTTETHIQMPNSDAWAVLFNQKNLLVFLRDFGDVELVLDEKNSNSHRTQYTVPAFAESRQRYIASKAKYCQQWGCE